MTVFRFLLKMRINDIFIMSLYNLEIKDHEGPIRLQFHSEPLSTCLLSQNTVRSVSLTVRDPTGVVSHPLTVEEILVLIIDIG